MINKYLTKGFYFNLFLISLIFIFDRLSKIYVIYLNQKNNDSLLFSSKFLDINLVWNDGIAFGLFSFEKEYLYNLLTSLIIIVIFIVFVMLLKSSGFKKYCLLMILGGALGNLYDRIFFKAVPDFFDFHINEFHWFIFNVSDIFISLGVIFMIILEIIDNKENKFDEKN